MTSLSANDRRHNLKGRVHIDCRAPLRCDDIIATVRCDVMISSLVTMILWSVYLQFVLWLNLENLMASKFCQRVFVMDSWYVCMSGFYHMTSAIYSMITGYVDNGRNPRQPTVYRERRGYCHDC